MTKKESPAPGGSRRRGRILALQGLFEADLVGHDPLEALTQVLEEEAGEPDAEKFARRLLSGVVANRAAIDRTLEIAAPAWPLAQMPAVDKSLLRLAIYEVLFDNKRVPVKAAINEAVEIAKEFGSENSSRFVNGVLGTVVAGQEKRAKDRQSSLSRCASLVDVVPEEPPTKQCRSGRMADETFTKVKKIIVEQLGVEDEQVEPSAAFVEDLNADSLDLVELIMSLEEEFGMEISDEAAAKIQTVQDAVDYIHEHQL